VPKIQVVVDYGPLWNEMIDAYGSPFGGEPTHSGPPTLTRSVDVYGPWFTEADLVLVKLPPDLDEVLAYDVDALFKIVTDRLDEEKEKEER
jgi:hypothetical protein